MLEYMKNMRRSSHNIQINLQHVSAQVIRYYFHELSKGVLRSHHSIRAKILANERNHILTFSRVLGVERVADHFQISVGTKPCTQFSFETVNSFAYLVATLALAYAGNTILM